MDSYDFIVIGGGISGLYAMTRIHQKYPHAKLLLLEKNKMGGGRVGTSSFCGTSVNIGAGIGRKSKDVTLQRLLKEYNIRTREYQGSNTYANIPREDVHEIMKTLNSKYNDSNETVKSKTFKQFAQLVLGERVYRNFVISTGFSDFEKADIYETLFFYGMDDNYGNMATYIGIPWTELIHKLYTSIHRLVKINQEVKSITLLHDNGFQICTQNAIYDTKKVVLATTVDTVRKLLPTYSIYHDIQGQPFLRVYGKFALGSRDAMRELCTKTTVVNGPLQMIIPINVADGIYMIAYSDNKSALSLHPHCGNTEKNRHFFATEVQHALGLEEPLKLTQMKSFFWNIGTHYYTPLTGKCSRRQFIYKAQHPTKNLYVVGEMVSRDQGWVEGALKSVDCILPALLESEVH